MSRLPQFSIRLHGSMPPKACILQAQAADAAGFAGIWFAENAFARGILPAASACATATVRLKINSGVFNPFSRHPTMMAMETGALDELSGGRASLSVGTGVISALEKIGLKPGKPLSALRDTITIARTLLRGEQADYSGPMFSARRVKLDYLPRADIPIFVAGRGNLIVKLAAELADGLIVSNMCSAAFSARLASLLQATRRAKGQADAQMIQYVPCAVSDLRSAAISAAQRIVGEMLPGYWRLGQTLGSAKEGLLAGTDISGAELAAASARLSAGEDAAQLLDERYTTAFALAGTPEDCLAEAEKYAAAGVCELALTFSGTNAVQDIRAIATALTSRQRAETSAAAG
ncbi:MAG: LLM class flavin-dependent oxidoreductase [Pseudomonadota bacterium]